MIQINDDWGVSVNEISVDLHKKEIKKTGEVYWRPKYYFPTLKTALLGLVDRGLATDDELTSFKDLSDRVDDLKALIIKYIDTA